MGEVQRETLEYDVLIVGGGPAGLAAAVRLGQLARDAGSAPSICLLEKGAAIGAHLVSGAVIDTAGLDALLPDWRACPGFAFAEVTDERHLVLGEDSAWAIPSRLMPPQLRQSGNIVASLGELCRWLAQEAEALGIDLVTGFAATEALVEEGRLAGVLTGDMGRDRHGRPRSDFSPGVAIRAHYTLMAEGARGSLTGQLEKIFGLREGCAPQKYALGLKELWRLDPAQHQPGLVIHAAGWPFGREAMGGAFLYHLPDGLAAVGLVAHLDYRNPWFDPFREFQRAKTHLALREFLSGGERIGFGARVLACGGVQSLPRLAFPGGALLGCAAGLLDGARSKGIHAAMLSGIAAAEVAFAARAGGRRGDELHEYASAIAGSRLWKDLQAARNFKPWLGRLGKGPGGLLAGSELWLAHMGLRVPWTLAHSGADHAALQPASRMARIDYPKPDGVISFDRPSSLLLAGIQHAGDQPCHLHLQDPALPVGHNLPRFTAPETRYCPAGVYEIAGGQGEERLLIHPAFCLHCKTCDIKDPGQNIVWVPPEGGSGPNYPGL